MTGNENELRNSVKGDQFRTSLYPDRCLTVHFFRGNALAH